MNTLLFLFHLYSVFIPFGRVDKIDANKLSHLWNKAAILEMSSSQDSFQRMNNLVHKVIPMLSDSFFTEFFNRGYLSPSDLDSSKVFMVYEFSSGEITTTQFYFYNYDYKLEQMKVVKFSRDGYACFSFSRSDAKALLTNLENYFLKSKSDERFPPFDYIFIVEVGDKVTSRSVIYSVKNTTFNDKLFIFK